MKDTRSTGADATITLGADLSPAVVALERGLRLIQRKQPEVPNATIVVKRDARAWGHTTVNHAWAPNGQDTPDRLEIMISGENLARGAREVAATLLHESAHAANLAAGIRDCDVNGRHNRKFADRAESFGLTVTANSWHGLASTSLDDDGAKRWKALIAIVQTGLDKSAIAPPPPPVPAFTGGLPGIGIGGITITGPGGLVAPPKRGNRNLLKAVCGCGHSIRLSRAVLVQAEPTCQVCQEKFVA